MDESAKQIDASQSAINGAQNIQLAPPNANDTAQAQAAVQRLEAENRRILAEFNMQRAKMKELFLQKEAELTKCQRDRNILQREQNELKSQLLAVELRMEGEMRKKELQAQEEILSLQQLVQDTIEESAICKTELHRLKEESNRLLLENRDMRDGLLQQQLQQQQHQQQHQHHQQQQESVGLAPHMLNQVKKTLVRKLGGDSNSASAPSVSFNLPSSGDAEETVRTKGMRQEYAQEDAEVLRSIVEQLQEEMKALKGKLREADDKLQANSANSLLLLNVSSDEANADNTGNKSNTMESAAKAVCVECEKTNAKIEELLAKSKKDKAKIEELEKSVAEAHDDIDKEGALRKDLENDWQEKRELHKNEVQKLQEQVKHSENQLLELQQMFLETKDEVKREVLRITEDRERVNKHLEILQADNDFLSGRYLATAEEIESQNINLPNTVEELQELVLQQRGELIQARVGSESEKRKCATSLDEIQILRDQLKTSNMEGQMFKRQMQKEVRSLQERLKEHLLTLQNYETTKTTLERKESELNRQVSLLRVEIIELQEAKEKLTIANSDYKAKVKNLQEEIATSEQVQKDFVKLSQTLQMSLEKLRHADTEVRWQDEEDIGNCPTCNIYFTVTVRKIHCRHCGHIYCDKCLTKTVPSGPRKRIARVCDICHTLLTPNTAPYFSQEPLQPT